MDDIRRLYQILRSMMYTFVLALLRATEVIPRYQSICKYKAFTVPLIQLLVRISFC